MVTILTALRILVIAVSIVAVIVIASVHGGNEVWVPIFTAAYVAAGGEE